MNARARVACYSAAVAVLLCWGGSAPAQVLNWDNNGTAAPLGADGDGSWDLVNPNWVSGGTTSGTNVVWSNTTPPASAYFGASTNTAINGALPHYVDLGAAITVQDITLNTASDGATYSLSDFSGGSLTWAGNMTKASPQGQDQLQFYSGPLNITSGTHTVAINDTPGDVAELLFNCDITGNGGFTLDNGSTYAVWGTMVLTGNDTYKGATVLNKGRLIVTSNNALSTTPVSIGSLGTLSIGGGGTGLSGQVTVSNPITITRNTYTGGDYGRYGCAIINNDGSNSITGPITIDSTDGRISGNSTNLTIPSNILQGPDVTAATLSIAGSNLGVVTLTGDNTALQGGINIVSGNLSVFNQNNIAGPSSSLQFNGTGYLRINGGFMSDFGSHVVNYSSFGGGIDLPDASQTFTISQNLTGGFIGKRGQGTINFNGTNTMTGNAWFEGGVVNVNANMKSNSIHMRTATLNIADGVTFTTTGGYSSFGQDSPDNATVNILGSGSLVATNQDFNISDNSGTTGTFNITGNGTLTVAGAFYIAKNNPTSGTLNQSGGTVNANRTGGNSLDIGQGTGAVGLYNKTGGTLNVAGEMWIGNNAGGTGTFYQTAGSTTVNNWFVVGRFGATGTADISGGTVTHQGGGNSYVGEGTTGVSTMTLRNNASFTAATGEFWVGNSGGNGTLTVQDSASLSVVNNWMAIGRGGVGVVNLSGNGSISKAGANNLTVAAISNTSTGTLNQTGGTFTSNSTWLSEAGAALFNISAGTDNFGTLDVGHAGGGSAELRISGTADVTAGTVTMSATSGATVTGTINLNGGSFTANSINGGAGTGTTTINFNGGKLRAGANAATFLQGLTAANVGNGGATIDSNGHTITIVQALLAGGSGGLTKSGSGTLTLTGANTYTGATTVNGGTVVLGSSAWNPVLTGGGAVINNSEMTFNYTGATSPAGTVVPLLKSSHDDLNFRDATQRFSTANAADATHGLGYLDDAVSQLSVMYTWYGDANLDGKITADDYALIDRGYAKGLSGWVNGDFNYDGKVDSADYLLIDTSFGKQSGGFSPGFLAAREGEFGQAYVAALTAAVPEPASLGLLGAGAAALLGQRRRKMHI